MRKIFLQNALYLIGILLGNIVELGLAFTQQYTHFLAFESATYNLRFAPIEINWLDILLINSGTIVVCLLV